MILVVAAFIGAAQAVPAEVVSQILEYREKCIAWSGSDEGYQQFLQSIQPAKICVLNRMDVQQLQMDAMELASGARKPFFDKYCPIFNESMSCFDDTLEGIAKCVGDDGDRVKAILKTLAHNLLDLACQNDGELFFDAQEPEFKQCITQLKGLDAQECKLSDSTKNMSILKYGEQQCRELNDVLQCVKKKMEECHTPTLSYVVEVVFNTISNAIDCKQLDANRVIAPVLATSQNWQKVSDNLKLKHACC